MSTSRTLITGAMLRKHRSPARNPAAEVQPPRPAPRPAPARKPAATEVRHSGSGHKLRVVPHPRVVAVMDRGEEPVATNPQFRAPHLGYRRD